MRLCLHYHFALRQKRSLIHYRIRDNGSKPKDGRFSLNVRGKFSLKRWQSAGMRCSEKLWMFLEVFKAGLGGALGSLPSAADGIFEVPSSSNHSIIHHV